MDFRVSLLILVIFVLFYGINYGDAVRCFQCHNIADPMQCNNIATCSSTEYCYSEQVINSTGSILYNTGCRVKEHCGTTPGVLMGRRMMPSYHGNNSDFTVDKRSADISTCIKCCNHDTCNNQGCGLQATNIQQRGPYCYTCNVTSHPSLCKTATMCGQDEMCFVYIPSDYYLSTVPMYRSQCISKAACTVISQAVFNPNCPPKCCDNDYCNDECGSTHLTTPDIATATSGKTPITYMPTTSTAVPTTSTLSTTASTARPTTTSTTLKTTAIPQTIGDTGCKTDHYYDVITGLCIKIIESQQLSYHDAKQACESIGERLVTIDSHEKTSFIDYTLLHHSSIHQLENRNYWTSAYDLHNNSKYFWLNGAQTHYTNWGGGDEVASNQQPDDIHEKNQDCVMLYGLDGYRWHDTLCQHTEYYICENPNTLLHMGTPSKDNSCKAGHYYDSYTGLCIKLFETTQLTYNGAKAACQHFGDTLVTIDTHEKTIFIDNLLIHQSILPEEDQRVYWIGAYDTHSNKVFYWPNGHEMHYTNWGGGDEVAQNQQPDSDRRQNCVLIYGRDHYRWHDDGCNRKQFYICEYTKSTPHRFIVPSTTVSQHQTTTLTVATTLSGNHGPLCYTCDNMNQPNECTNYTQCKTNEVCMVHLSTSVSIATGHNVYRSKCELANTCNLIASLDHNQHCHSTCCSSDLCNNKCSQPLKQVTTATPTTTTPRPTTITTKAPPPSSGQCPTSSGWQTLHTGSTTMCIKIYTETRNWEAARQTCQGDHNSDLVVMDTSDKMSLIRSWLTNHGQYSNLYGFWFGAYDKEHNNHFVWVKSNSAVRDGDWDNGQPNHVDGGHDQNCGMMWNQSTQRFQWHDDYCAYEFPFVCEL